MSEYYWTFWQLVFWCGCTGVVSGALALWYVSSVSREVATYHVARFRAAQAKDAGIIEDLHKEIRHRDDTITFLRLLAPSRGPGGRFLKPVKL